MSKTKIPDRVVKQLLIKSAGRCQYRGCNISLSEDVVTKRNFNQAYLAHIVADSPGGPRGHIDRSSLLSKKLSNIMLLCDSHHRLIDKIDVGGHPESLLINMKEEHEQRIERVVSINPECQSHIVIYKANVGEHAPVLNYANLSEFLLPEYYPAQSNSIDLGLTDSPLRDKDDLFWDTELKVLEDNFNQRLKPLISQQKIERISLFAFAPMPLLIKLGTLLNDIQNVELFQPKRNPKSWKLSDDNVREKFLVTKPVNKEEVVALNISLSATIDNSRITSVLGEECSLYTITIKQPFNDFLQSKSQLQDFSICVRLLLDEIKLRFSANTELEIFPAIPVALAIELGRVWMPKADMPLTIYEQNKSFEGFKKIITIC